MKTSICKTGVALLMAVSAFSCGQNGRINLTHQVTGQAERPAPPMDGAPAMEVADKINKGDATLEQGLLKMRSLLMAASNNDAGKSLDASQDSTSVSTIAEAVFKIKRGEPVSNLAAILGAAAVKGDNIDKTTLNSLFASLKNREADTALHQDAFLIRFLILHYLNQIERRGFANASPVIRSYFSGRIEKKLQSQAAARAIINEYASLSELAGLMSPRLDGWFHRIFFKPLDLAGIDEWTSGARRVTKKFISIWSQDPHGRLALTQRHVDAAIANAGSIISMIRNSNYDSADAFWTAYRPALEIIDDLNGIFDRALARFSWNVDMKSWSGLTDERWRNVLKPLRSLIADTAVAVPGSFSDSSVLPKHPLTRTYHEQALLLAGRTPTTQQTLNEKSKSFHDAVTTFSGMRTRATNPVERRIYEYMKHYYNVELGRLHLAGRPAEPEKHEQIRDYGAITCELKRALARRYLERLRKFGIDPENCDWGSDNRVYFLIAGIAKELVETKTDTTLEYRYAGGEKELEVTPGIYESDMHVDMHVRAISFHPLAMIHAPGKNIRIHAGFSKVEDAWIDVSGLPAPGLAATEIEAIRHNTDKGRIPAVFEGILLARKSDNYIKLEHINTFDEREKRKTSLTRYNSDELAIMWGFKYWNPGHNNSCEQGRPPADPGQAPSGQNAGSIIVSSNQNSVFMGLPLLVSAGGNGAPGVPGLESPQCVNGQHVVLKKHAIKHPTDHTGRLVVNPHEKDDDRRYLRFDMARNGNWGALVAEVFDEEANIPAGNGGPGGNGGLGGNIAIPASLSRSAATIINAKGIHGRRGAPGSCEGRLASRFRDFHTNAYREDAR